jgi:mono/diheme cytochrome c family protein
LAGDVIVQVNNDRVTTLEEFQQSSRWVRNLSQVPLTVLRKGDQTQNGRFTITRMTLLLRAEPDLGFAQVEAAPMIAPGDGRPHRYRGPCTVCHTIGTGFELTPDPDLIVLPPPAITKATADTGVSPHLDRGPCIACHTIFLQ